MNAPKCKLCDTRHWGLCPLGVFAHIMDVPGVPNIPEYATNTEESATNRIVSEKTLNRRDRKVYNEYQKDYMRRIRGGV